MILPFHRDDIFLREAIRSVLSNKGVSVRLLLVDDRINPEFIPDLDAKIMLRTGGLGYAGAINSAKKLITSDYVALMNSDDWCAPDRFLRQINALSLSGCDLAICGMKKFKDKRLVTSMLGEIVGEEYDSRLLILGAYGANATWLSTKKTWMRFVHFEDSSISDWLSGLTFFSKINVVLVNQTLYWYRQHSLQITNELSQKTRGFHEIIDQASGIAVKLKIFDENFESNFRITAAPYSLSKNPDRGSLKNAWEYLKKIENANLPGASIILKRRKLYVSLRLLKLGYFNGETLLAMMNGGVELIFRFLIDRVGRVPKDLGQRTSLLVSR